MKHAENNKDTIKKLSVHTPVERNPRAEPGIEPGTFDQKAMTSQTSFLNWNTNSSSQKGLESNAINYQ